MTYFSLSTEFSYHVYINKLILLTRKKKRPRDKDYSQSVIGKKLRQPFLF